MMGSSWKVDKITTRPLTSADADKKEDALGGSPLGYVQIGSIR